MPVFQVQKAAAEWIGVRPSSLRLWTHEPGFPDCSEGYDTDAIEQWRATHKRARPPAVEGLEETKAQQEEELLLKLIEQNNILRLQREALEKKYYLRTSVELVVSTWFTEFHDWCQQAADLIAPVLPVAARKKFKVKLVSELDALRRRMDASIRQKLLDLDEEMEAAKNP